MNQRIGWVFLGWVSALVVQAQPLNLWYRQPAQKWTEALPVGNGRLGAMIFGGVAEDRLQLNEATLWTGKPRSYVHAGAWQYLDTIRQLLFAGKQKEAEALATDHFLGLKDPDERAYEQQRTTWLQTAAADTAWAAPGIDDAAWPVMQVPTPEGWERAGHEGLDGIVWMRNSFVLPAAWKGKDLTIDLGRIRDLDVTYINGVRVGTLLSTTDRRRYTIPARLLREGKNVVAVQVINFYDKGGLIGVKNNSATLCVYPASDPADTLALAADWKFRIRNQDPPAYPQFEASYQPLGDLLLKFGSESGPPLAYERRLNIAEAIATTRYTNHRGIRFTRAYFASHPDSSLVVRLTTSQPGSIGVEAVFRTDHQEYNIQRVGPAMTSLYVKVKNGALYGTAYLTAKVKGGTVQLTDSGMVVQGASEVVFYLTAATNFKNFKDVSGNPDLICKQILQKATKKTYDQLRAAHIKDYQALFSRYTISLPATADAALPTDERIRKFVPATDPSLLALYQQYGRYLLIAASRPGGQAANLQGIWNDLLTPPWGSKYTTNINLQMNYWPAAPLNLAECAEPLWPLLSDLSVAGALTAKAHYNAPGWVLHHNTDLWRGTVPINAANHGIWPTGGAWLSTHIWEQYLFTRNRAFLEKYYPVMKGAAVFFAANLVIDPVTGYLISTPSNSPEHGGLVAGPTMDHQIIRELFRDCIEAARIMTVDTPFVQQLQALLPQMAPNRVGRYGQLQEWLQDVDDPKDQHRHVSHLWGVYPGTDISWKEENLMKAARQSLLFRGDSGTGWSLAWKANLWARFKDGAHTLRILQALLHPAIGPDGREGGGVYDNLMDAHPPFQIDGNFGGAAAIAEMLVQSQSDTIELLPALPAALPTGAVKGLCARGGFVLDLTWQGGKLQQVTIRSKAGLPCRLKYGSQTRTLTTRTGGTYRLNGSLN